MGFRAKAAKDHKARQNFVCFANRAQVVAGAALAILINNEFNALRDKHDLYFYEYGIAELQARHRSPRVMFEQFTYRFGTREFIVYNPRDEQAVTAHALDLLELTPQQLALERQRGHYEEQLAPVPHWKYFRFD